MGASSKKGKLEGFECLASPTTKGGRRHAWTRGVGLKAKIEKEKEKANVAQAQTLRLGLRRHHEKGGREALISTP